ncbi:MAG TPA: hypothetical protein PKC87_02680 [Candidatus Absconditabacterales bacterium]|nr:hypothetical protein [Candidatus Absconditabacterales bacterium]
MKKIFHNFTFTRRQAGLFKLCIASVGILLAIYFPETLKNLEVLRWILFLVIGTYLGYLYFRQ